MVWLVLVVKGGRAVKSI